jgi:glycolate oxidase iron-sulfur subunit
MSLKKLDFSILQQCMHCGMCLPSCPTYDTTKRERNSPRGRIALMRAVATDEIPLSKSFADEMSFCLGCLACQSACPAAVDYATLFETSRAEIEATGVSVSAPRRLLRFLTLDLLFTRPRFLRVVGKLLRFYQVSGAENLVRKILPKRLRELERQTPRMAAQFSNDLIDQVESGDGSSKKVALLTGCVQDLVFSQVNRDTADVLLANSCEVHTPSVQPCCGSIHSHNGEPEMARENARRLLDLLPPQDFDAIISNAGGCGSHLRHFSKLLPNDPRAALWDAKVRDVHEFLAEIEVRSPDVAPFEEEKKVTYHDSCHLAHGQKVTLEPRQVIDLIPGIERVDLSESDWCCGSAGVYSLTQPEQSQLLLERKVGHIRTTGAEILLTANPGCVLQIQNGMPELKIMNPVSLLAQAYRNESKKL